MHFIKLFCHPFFKTVGGEMEHERKTHAACKLKSFTDVFMILLVFGGFSGQGCLCLCALYASQLLTNEQSQRRQIWLLPWTC